MSERRVHMRSRSATWEGRWTNPSVIGLMSEEEGDDPLETITRRARRKVLEALDAGWRGPPFDPIQLADLLNIEVAPRADIDDAQTVPVGASRARIEFNPNRPAGRVRYSIAHEIAHTLFTDCGEQVRQRLRHQDAIADEWQLEALCNVGAAEILMPFGSLAHISSNDLTIERLMHLQKGFQVSSEALVIRVIRLVDAPCAMFCASRVEAGPRIGRYRIDYMIGSQNWALPRVKGALLPEASAIAECATIGFTTTADEMWDERIGKFHVEAVGVPPYPGSTFPRVVGVIRPFSNREGEAEATIRYVRGSATAPRGSGLRVVVQVVNDKTPNWGGGGFAQAIRRAWPAVQEDFQMWAQSNRAAFRLAAVRLCEAAPNVVVASIVAQKGYGTSSSPRIRYGALREGLELVAREAASKGASLHMPRLGAGQAGGAWPVIEDLIRATCSEAGVSATIYDLPGAEPPPEGPQRELRFR